MAGSLHHFGNRRDCATIVAADKLFVPVDHQLRRVDAAAVKDGVGVVHLALAEGRRRKRIAPAEMIPIVHVFAERNDVSARHRLRGHEARQYFVGGRTARTAFRRKELDEDRNGRARSLGRETRRGPECGHQGDDNRGEFQAQALDAWN